MIYVFAFERYYPAGAVNDLIAVIDDSERDKTDQHGRLRKDVLEKALAQANRQDYFEYVQVMHVHPDGTVRLVEKFEEAPLSVQSANPDNLVRGPKTAYVPMSPADDAMYGSAPVIR